MTDSRAKQVGNGARSKRLSAAERAYVQIKEMILMGEIAPLQHIDERELREQLDIGRTPIREAVQRLAYHGLVTVVPFRGTIASGIDLSDLDQIMELRVPLEVLGGRLAAQRVGDEDIERLYALVRRYDVPALCEDGELAELLRLDDAVHQGITDLAQNRFLSDDLQELRDLTWRFHILFYRRRRPTPDNSFNNYAELIDALATRDPDEVEAATRAHFRDYEQGFPK